MAATSSGASTTSLASTIGPRGLVMTGQVVEQAGQLDRPADLAVHHLGADAALADQQALVDQFLNGAPHGRAGQSELFGEADLVVEPIPGDSWPSLIACSICWATW